MNWPYYYTPYIWPSCFTVAFLIGLSVYSWRHRGVPGALPFAIGSLLGALWAAGSVLEYAATDVTAKIFWFRFQAAWQLPAITAITCFLLEYAWPGRWLTRRNVVLLSIMPVLDLLLIMTNNLHHLEWLSLGLASDGSATATYGPVYWFVLAYGFGLGIVNLVVLAWLFLRSPQHRWPVVIMVIGQITARTVFLLDATSFVPSRFPLDILGLGFLFLMYAVVLFGFRLFDPMPLARERAIEELHAGVLVLDSEGRILSLNPFAERTIGVSTKLAKGRPITELLPAYPDGTEVQLGVGAGQEARDYTMAISPLQDWRGLDLGRLLFLRDVTEQKKAHAKLLEQARALAVLQERDRLARELHDDLGQVLGYIKMQTQTAREHLAQNQKSVADADLAQLSAVVQDLHSDVREYILGAQSGNSLEPGFIPVLQQYLRRFGDSYGIQMELISPPELAEDTFEPTVEVQLLRLIQEALTNARKHAHANLVQVSIRLLDCRAQITVQDNGDGFDPAVLGTGEGQRFGLRFMRERADGIGGTVEIDTSPGAGTRVIIYVPLSPQTGQTLRSYHEGLTRR